MIQIILGLITFAAASIQDYLSQTVSVILLLPYYLTVLGSTSAQILIFCSIILTIYYVLRQNYNLSTGLGTADLLLAAPTFLVFNNIPIGHVAVALFAIPVFQAVVGYGDKTAAIPGMSAGYILLVLLS